VTPAFGGQYSIQLSYGRFCRCSILQTIEGHRNVGSKETRANDLLKPFPGGTFGCGVVELRPNDPRATASALSEGGRIELAFLPLQIRLDISHDRFEFGSVPNGVEVMGQ
jgi:hypothetical protein